MDEQFKNSVMALVEAANVACQRGAFNLSEAGQLDTASQIVLSTFKKVEALSKSETQKANESDK